MKKQTKIILIILLVTMIIFPIVVINLANKSPVFVAKFGYFDFNIFNFSNLDRRTKLEILLLPIFIICIFVLKKRNKK